MLAHWVHATLVTAGPAGLGPPLVPILAPGRRARAHGVRTVPRRPG